MKKYLILILLFCLSHVSFSQTISGIVKDSSGELLIGVNVFSKKHNIGTSTNFDGEFEIKRKSSMDVLSFSYLGFYETNLKLVSGKNKYVIVLKEDDTALQEVLIIAKTKAEFLREEAYAVEVIESEVFKNVSVNASEILNRVSGVNIRKSGGLGEDAVLSLNGLSGSQVRLFIDGIPMEYFGSSLSLNNFPANLIDRIEVYKGVVPIHLSGDALGGAINIVTNSNQKSFLDVSYSLGSFNTNIASVNGQYRNKESGFTARVKSFYNYSDNNYKVDVNLLDSSTGRYDEFTTEVEHFHDAYESKMAWAEVGFTKVDFADELMVGVLYSDNYDEIQQPSSVLGDNENPFGEILEKEKKIVTTLNYGKNHFLHENLSFSSYLVGVLSEAYTRDLSSYQYDWFGIRTLRTDQDTGEADNRKTELTIESKNILGNINLGYSFSDVNSLAFNYSLNFLDMDGEDPYNNENSTRFGDPISFNKQVFSGNYTHSFFDDKFKNSVFTKYYKYTQTSTDANYFGIVLGETSADYNHFGYGFSSTYIVNDFQFKTSFEHAVRFPDVIELYGNGLGIDANQGILPEESNNYNIGVIYKKRFYNNSLLFSTNGFVRNVKNFIYIVPGIPSYYDNLADVISRGVDFSANYNYDKKLIFSLAGTYTDKVNNEKYIAGGPNSLYKQRVPNDPYLYGNATVSFVQKNLFQDQDSAALSINESYVHEFYYSWSNLGYVQSKKIVPSQLTTDIDLVYSSSKQTYNVSFGVLNVFDTKTYDNLFQQNPGRAFNFKLRYFIN